MPPSVGIVADDLTGGADTGAAFLARRLSTIAVWSRAGIEGAGSLFDADVAAIVTRTRHADAQRAAESVSQAVSRLRQAGVWMLYKKIDSTLRGNVAVEVQAAIAAWPPGSLAIVAPAFPGTGRTTIGGVQRTRGVPLPGVDSVPALLEAAGVSSGLVDIASVRTTALESILEECRKRGVGAVVCDAESDADLRIIARAGARLAPAVIWVGSGGLAHAIAAESGNSGSQPDADVPRITGPVLIVIGSTTEVARAQASHLEAAGVRRIAVPAKALAGETPGAAAGVLRDVETLLAAGRDVMVTFDSTPGANRGDDPRLTARLGELLQPCVTAVAAAILTGGDTAIGVLDAWGVAALRLVTEIETGVVLSETIDARALPIVTKAGSFGDPGTLTRVLSQLKRG